MDVSRFLNAPESSATDGFSRWLMIYSLKPRLPIIASVYYINRNIFIIFMPQVDFFSILRIDVKSRWSLLFIHCLYLSQSCTDWLEKTCVNWTYRHFWTTAPILRYFYHADTFSRIRLLILAQNQKHINWAKRFVLLHCSIKKFPQNDWLCSKRCIIYYKITGENKIPFYEYHCKNCDTRFERLVSISTADKKQNCPNCGKKNIEKLLSTFSIKPSSSVAASGGGFTWRASGCWSRSWS